MDTTVVLYINWSRALIHNANALNLHFEGAAKSIKIPAVHVIFFLKNLVCFKMLTSILKSLIEISSFPRLYWRESRKGKIDFFFHLLPPIWDNWVGRSLLKCHICPLLVAEIQIILYSWLSSHHLSIYRSTPPLQVTGSIVKLFKC